MRVLLLNQCFYPDVVSTAQHLTDLAIELAARKHQVTVITGDRGYDDPAMRFQRRETWNKIRIIRIPLLALGKSSRWRRALSFASFLAICALRLLRTERFDVVITLTSPPLISLLGSWFCLLKGGRFIFWVMDLNPDEAVAAGWLKEQSIPAKMLGRCLRLSLRRADRIVVLDRFMKQRLLEKGTEPDKIFVLPPWSQDDQVRYDGKGGQEFRAEHDLEDKFVVMYSGNHSPCHPLDTLLAAAKRLSERNDLAFCFVGGGTEQLKVRAFAKHHHLRNVRCLPYQPFSALSGSLSAADLHAVVMGDRFPGIVHPCKIYNILSIGKPVIYIGPVPSHITDISAEINGFPITRAGHGDVDGVVQNILQLSGLPGAKPPSALLNKFSKATLLPQLIHLIEATSPGVLRR